MRSSLITIAIFTILYICVSSCGGSSGGDSNQDPPFEESLLMPEGDALSENQIAANPTLQVNADRDTYVTFLEPINTSEELNFTGETGFDLFSYVYEMAINHTICWEDEDPGAAHFMTISDSTGAQVLRVEANGECITQLIEPGIYKARVDHDNLSEIILPIFFVPQLSQVASKDSGLLDNIVNTFDTIVSILDPVLKSHAQIETLDITTIIATNSCLVCNLEGIIIRGQNLSGVNFEGSNFQGAILEVGNFSDTNLMGSSLFSADLRGANFIGADLRAADLNFSEIDVCTNFLDADMTSAVWVDGCTCSDSTCSNCAEIPMMPVLGGDECSRIDGPDGEDPGDGPIVGPIDDPGDVPILSGN